MLVLRCQARRSAVVEVFVVVTFDDAISRSFPTAKLKRDEPLPKMEQLGTKLSIWVLGDDFDCKRPLSLRHEHTKEI